MALDSLNMALDSTPSFWPLLALRRTLDVATPTQPTPKVRWRSALPEAAAPTLPASTSPISPENWGHEMTAGAVRLLLPSEARVRCPVVDCVRRMTLVALDSRRSVVGRDFVELILHDGTV